METTAKQRNEEIEEEFKSYYVVWKRICDNKTKQLRAVSIVLCSMETGSDSMISLSVFESLHRTM